MKYDRRILVPYLKEVCQVGMVKAYWDNYHQNLMERANALENKAKYLQPE